MPHPSHQPSHPKPPAKPKSLNELRFQELLKTAAHPNDPWHDMQIYAVDANSKKVLLNFGGEKTHNPASLTKLMTFYIACMALADNAVSKTDVGKTEKLAGNKNKYDMKADQTKPFNELVDIMMTASDNVAATTVANLIKEKLQKIAKYDNASLIEKIKTGRDHPEEVPPTSSDSLKKLLAHADNIPAMMEQVARELGMTKTHFVNSHGLYIKSDGGENVTTPHDMVVLMQAIYDHYPKQAESQMNQTSVKYDGNVHKSHYFLNDPKSPMALPEGFKAIAKTGYLEKTDTATVGYNINARITNAQGKAIQVVIMGAPHYMSTALARDVGLSEDVIASQIAVARRAGLDRHTPIIGNRAENAMVTTIVKAKTDELSLPELKPTKLAAPAVEQMYLAPLDLVAARDNTLALSQSSPIAHKVAMAHAIKPVKDTTTIAPLPKKPAAHHER